MKILDALVVGGGISGLSTAWWLAEQGASVAVWECKNQPGGKIRSKFVDGYRVENAATMLMESDGRVRYFLARSGLDQYRNARDMAAKRYLVHQGELVAISKRPGALLRSPLWSHRGRARMLIEPLVRKSTNKNETVREFTIRRFGRELYEKAMDPYIAGPLASDPERACARSVLPLLTDMERRFGSVTGGILSHCLRSRRVAYKPKSVSFTGGMQQLTDQLAGDPRTGFRGAVRVVEISRGNGIWSIRGISPGGEVSTQARQLILSTPAGHAARLVSKFDSELATLLSGIEYAPLTVVHLGYAKQQVSHSLDGAGFLVPGREKLMVNGALWMSSLMPECAPENNHLLTGYIGGARNPAAASWSDERSSEVVHQTLSTLLDIRGAPEFVHIDRHHAALPQYVDAYHARVQAINNCVSQHPALNLCANYMGGVAIRNRVEQAYQCAASVLAGLEKRSGERVPPACFSDTHYSGA